MKKELKTELTKEKILDAALLEFGAKGYAGASINSICGEGMPKGLLYHNFKSKDALYLACVKQSFDKLTDHLNALPSTWDPQRYMNARMCFFRENKPEARLFFESLLQPPVSLKEQIAQLRKEFDALNQKLYQEILARLSLRAQVTPADAMQYFTLMQSMFNGYFSSPEISKLPLSELVNTHEDQLFKLLDFMLYGIAERRDAQ